MRVSSSAFTDNFLNQINLLQQQQSTLQQQASSGLKVSQLEDNPGVMSQVLNMQASMSANTQYQANITQLQNGAAATSTGMNSLQTISARVSEIATLATNGTTSHDQFNAYATEMASLIKQAVQVANTQDADGHYIFSGTAITTKPFSTTTDSAGNITGVSYQGNTNSAVVQTGPTTSATALVPGMNTTGSGPIGLFGDTRTGSDLFSNMLSLQQHLQSYDSASINTVDTPALTRDSENIINLISANGVMQSSLTAASSAADSNNSNLTTQISNETSADMATTLTQLSQTQNAYQAALESGTMIMKLSILNYIQ